MSPLLFSFSKLSFKYAIDKGFDKGLKRLGEGLKRLGESLKRLDKGLKRLDEGCLSGF